MSRQNKRVLFDMNILLNEKQTVFEPGYIEPETSIELRGMRLQRGL